MTEAAPKDSLAAAVAESNLPTSSETPLTDAIKEIAPEAGATAPSDQALLEAQRKLQEEMQKKEVDITNHLVDILKRTMIAAIETIPNPTQVEAGLRNTDVVHQVFGEVAAKINEGYVEYVSFMNNLFGLASNASVADGRGTTEMEVLFPITMPMILTVTGMSLEMCEKMTNQEAYTVARSAYITLGVKCNLWPAQARSTTVPK